MQIEVIEQLDDIYELKPRWDALFEKANPGLFLHHSWVYNNYKYFKADSLILLAVYGDNRTLIGVFPFAIRNFRIKFLKFRALVHGGSAVTDYSYFMIDPDTNRRLMIKRVVQKLVELQPSNWDFFKIDNLSDGNDISNIFRNFMTQKLYAGDIISDVTPIIDFSHVYEEAKKISNIDRRFRKIRDKCIIQHLIGKEITDQLMSEFSRLHQKSYPSTSFDKPESQEFYKQLILDTDFSNHTRLSCIMHDGKMIAGHFGFSDQRVFYYYVPAYDENFSTFGPGVFLLWSLVNTARNENKLEFDLLRGSEDYKLNWANKINSNHTVFGVTDDSKVYKKLLARAWVFTK